MPESAVSREASWRMSMALLRIHTRIGHDILDRKVAALARAVKAFDPNQPRVPAGNPDGGQWTTTGGAGGVSAESTPASPEPGDTVSQPQNLLVLASLSRGSGGEPPKVPKERPRTAAARTRVMREVGVWVLRQAVSKRTRALLTILDQAGWLEPLVDNIRTFTNPPKTLQELQGDVVALKGKPGYDVHHIVEKGSAIADGFPNSMVNAPENLVRIPRLRHWAITGWYQVPNEDFGWKTPRSYLRGKDWAERQRVGRCALIDFGVLKE